MYMAERGRERLINCLIIYYALESFGQKYKIIPDTAQVQYCIDDRNIIIYKRKHRKYVVK